MCLLILETKLQSSHYLGRIRFLCCCYKLPQTGWLRTIHISCLTVLEARSTKSRCQQGRWLFLGPWGRLYPTPPSYHLGVTGKPQHSLACRCVASIPASVFTHSAPLCLVYLRSPCLFLIRSLVVGFQAHLDNPVWFRVEILNYIYKDPICK